MGMIRVYDLAKLLGMSSKELIDRLEQSGLQLKSHSSNVDEDQVRSLLTAAPPQKKKSTQVQTVGDGSSGPRQVRGGSRSQGRKGRRIGNNDQGLDSQACSIQAPRDKGAIQGQTSNRRDGIR